MLQQGVSHNDLVRGRLAGMSKWPNLIIEPGERGVAIRMSRGVTNALTTELLEALIEALGAAERDAHGVVLLGGEKFFSNGVDLEWALSQSGAQMRELFLALGACVLKLLDSPVPIVGAAQGHAIGGALAMLLSCDYRYASSGRVLLGKPEVLLGVPNPYFGDQVVRFVAGDYVASDLIYTGKLVSSEEALTLGLLHGVEPAERLEETAWERLHTLTELAPAAFSESKRMRTERLCARLREQMSARVARQVEIWYSPEAQTRLHAAAQRLKRRP